VLAFWSRFAGISLKAPILTIDEVKGLMKPYIL
jgi:hypothetical protein